MREFVLIVDGDKIGFFNTFDDAAESGAAYMRERKDVIVERWTAPAPIVSSRYDYEVQAWVSRQ